jgi:hypothetical protein
MIQSHNKSLGKNKYYNTQIGKKDNSFFFLLPSIVISSKRFLHWDIMMFSIFIGLGRYYIQFNIFETVKNTSIEILKQDIVALLAVLKTDNLILISDNNSINLVIDYLNKNTFLILLLKNANLQHNYINKIIIAYFKEQPFIIQKK